MGRGSGASGARGGGGGGNSKPSPELTSALVDNKQSLITGYLKGTPIGTEIDLRLNGVESTYKKESATQWSRSNSKSTFTNKELASNIQKANSSYKTVADFYDKAFKIRYK